MKETLRGRPSHADLTLKYWVKIEPAIGFACGFDEEGRAAVYFTISMR